VYDERKYDVVSKTIWQVGSKSAFAKQKISVRRLSGYRCND
jgi:hypothetical protein